mmetsp:Transcript_148258/g.261565  ORF Transcript_148258/g.261565 Transcript_148258/m.261565 type:complete len:259 (+) Transcript_148258:352-1128(+)
MIPVPLKTMPASSRIPSISISSSSPCSCTLPGNGGGLQIFTALPQIIKSLKSRVLSSSVPSSSSSRSKPSISSNFCFSSACFAGRRPAKRGCIASMPKVWYTVTASATAVLRVRCPKLSSMPAIMNGAMSSEVQEADGAFETSSASSSSSSKPLCLQLRRPGKCWRSRLTASRTPWCTLARSPARPAGWSRCLSFASNSSRPSKPACSALKSKHLRALSCKRKFESPSLSSMCSRRTPIAKCTSACETRPSEFEKASI